MDFFGNSFLDVRNQYVIPIIGYGVKRNKYQHWILKDILSSKMTEVQKSGSTITIEVEESDFYNALVCEIELFYNKTLLQLKEYNAINNKGTTWAFVALYYFLFFSATTLLRFFQRGYLFLERKHVKLLEEHSLAVHQNPIRLSEGTYYFSVNVSPNLSKVIVSISPKSSGVHKLTLNSVSEIIRQEMLPNADTYESLYLSSLQSFFRAFNPEFPSTMRNKLNYTGGSCIYDIESSLPRIDFSIISGNIKRKISRLNTTKELSNQLECTAYYATLLFNYINKLHEEYRIRSRYGRDFQRERRGFTAPPSMIMSE